MVHCNNVAAKLTEKYGAESPFCLYLYADDGLTGNFEITLHSSAPGPDMDMDNDIQIHSKKASGKFPATDWDNFFALVDDGCEQLSG